MHRRKTAYEKSSRKERPQWLRYLHEETPPRSFFFSLRRSQYSYQRGWRSRGKKTDQVTSAEQSDSLGYVLGSLVSLPTIAGAGHVTYRVPGLKVVVDCVYTATPVSHVSSCHSCIHVLHLCTLGCKHTHRIRVHPMFNKDCTCTYLSIFDHIC